MREKDEKFGMYLSSLARSAKAIDIAKGRLVRQDLAAEGVRELVEGAMDVLGPYLGETVSEPRNSVLTLPVSSYNHRSHFRLSDISDSLGKRILL
jgi:hypothetical protein